MTDQNQTLGSGRLLLDRFADGTKTGSGNFRYLGNSPNFATNATVQTLEHKDTDHGIRFTDLSIDIDSTDGGSFTLDDISRENLALMFRGELLDTSVASATAQTQTITVKKGQFYQIGQSAGNPQGLGNITIATIKVATVTIAAAGNWDADLDRGLLEILSTSTDFDDDDEAVITYSVAAHTASQVVGRNMSIYGHLKFVADNAIGQNRDGDFPYVKITPDGDYNLKDESWQTMGFSFTVLKLNSVTEKVYWKDVKAA
jgi:hypothetical protein